jgi:hypothetical protein
MRPVFVSQTLSSEFAPLLPTLGITQKHINKAVFAQFLSDDDHLLGNTDWLHYE